jgi:uncharacterized ferritin-like protein (DUF455 family)
MPTRDRVEVVAALVAFERLLLESLAGLVAAMPSLSVKIALCRNVWAAALRIRRLCSVLPSETAQTACSSLPDPTTVRLVHEWGRLGEEGAVVAGFNGVLVPFAIAVYARVASCEAASTIHAAFRDLGQRYRWYGRWRRRRRSIESSRDVECLRRLATQGELALGSARTSMAFARTADEVEAPARGRVIAALRTGEAREEVWFVASPADERRYLHQLAAFEINTFEAVSRHIAEFAGMPWEFQWDMARQIRDEVAHLALWLRRLTQNGVRLGEQRLSTHEFAVCTGHGLAGRLAMLERLVEASALDSIDLHRCLWAARGDSMMVGYFSRVQLDEIGHVRCGNKWLRRLCDGDDEIRRLVAHAEAVSRRRMLDEARRLERAGVVPGGNTELIRRKFDDPLQLQVDGAARLRAGFTEAEVAEEIRRRREYRARNSEEEGER